MPETRFLYESDHTPEENIIWLTGDPHNSTEEPWIKTILRTTTLTLTLGFLLHLARSI